MKVMEDDEIPMPVKQRRLRQKKDQRQKNQLKHLLHDSRPASLIAEETANDDKWLED